MACRSVLQDEQVFMNDFEKSVTGAAHLLPAVPRRQTLFIPEVLVEKAPNQVESSLNLSPQQLAAQKKGYEIAEKSKSGHAPSSEHSLNLSPDELTAQRKAFEKAEKDKISTDDKASIEALVVTDQSINITEQQEAYKKLQPKSLSNVEDDCMQQQVSKRTYEEVEWHDYNLGKGSRIQIPAPDSTHPMRYGTIKWTGFIPNAVGEVAGIELVK